ncbi:MAG: hypothetical protein ACO3QC_05800 [Phycisphaerales bacterium]
MNDAHPHVPSGDAADELDALLSRAVQGDASALRAVRARGAANPAVLEELALWQADELRLARAALVLAQQADMVELPATASRAMSARRPHLGWAVAATLALAWLGSIAFPRPAEPRTSVAGIAGPSFASSDEAFDAYVAKAREEGVVYGEVAPPVLVGSREVLGSGGANEGFEVIIVRQVYERRRAPELYGLERVGETGRMQPIVIRPRTEMVQ